jgi:hypothetical protein
MIVPVGSTGQGQLARRLVVVAALLIGCVLLRHAPRVHMLLGTSDPLAPNVNETALVIDFEDCSADDGDTPPGVYAGRVTGLDVRFTATGHPVPLRGGKQTLPLGHNLTITLTSDRTLPVPIGSTFAASCFGFPFWLSGESCPPRTVLLPLGLGGVYYAGAACPLPAGLDAAAATVSLPPVLPFHQLSFLQLSEVWVQMQQALPDRTKLTCAFIHAWLEGPEGQQQPSLMDTIPFGAFGW